MAVLRYVDASSDAEKVSMFGMRICDLDRSRRLICVAGYGYQPWIRESMGTLSGGQSSRSIVLIRRRGTLEHIRNFVPKQGLNRMDLAVDAWEHALGALPTENLSPIERKQKDQYSSELAAARAKFEDEKANPKRWGEAMQLGAGDVDKLPWKRAMTMIPELTASRTWNSSVRPTFTPRRSLDTVLILSSGCV